MPKILLIHGPNLNLLGKRKNEIYGNLSLEEINHRINEYAEKKGIKIDIHQSNSEGEIVGMIHKAEGYDGLVINPGAYTHTSIAIRDAIEATKIKAIEVHISNIYARETFRHKSLIAPVCIGQITGLSWYGYILALEFFLQTGDVDVSSA
ncbi:MAG: type II 3-dehydroquinate dehydratase [candidate division WOR-3 bacterium]|nr:type II 3-dehydroquinate dehydratase [candidate division WOR-3 bacterium]